MKVDRKVQQKTHINFSLPNNLLQIQSDLKLIPTVMKRSKMEKKPSYLIDTNNFRINSL